MPCFPRIPAVMLLVLMLLGGVPAFAAEQHTELAGRTVAYWPPATPPADHAKSPLILFSHGFKGCATQSRFLMDALAAQGYWVFAPNHQDAACDGAGGGVFQRPEESFREPGAWSERTYQDRGQDIRILLSAIKQNPEWQAQIDFNRVGLVGHSLGGYTVLALAGAWPTWNLPGIRAVVALSPYTQPFNMLRTPAQIRVPVMYQGGTRDMAISPFVREAGGTYDQSPSPKVYVEFSGAGHFAWTNLQEKYHAAIKEWTLAFLNRYVQGNADFFAPSQDGVASARMDLDDAPNAAPGVMDLPKPPAGAMPLEPQPEPQPEPQAETAPEPTSQPARERLLQRREQRMEVRSIEH